MHRKVNRSSVPALTTVILCFLSCGTAAAQFELTGSWRVLNHEFLSGDGLPLDYSGTPLNDEGRLRGLSYSESQISMQERQCQGWSGVYLMQGPFGLKIWSDSDPIVGKVISYTIGGWVDRTPNVIWMDGRPHPSKYAEHTRAGFTTGKWEGDTLVTYTTHMSAGFLRKTGAPHSDETTMTIRFYRHGDLLTALAIVEDPIYLAEPFVLSRSWQATATPISPAAGPCIIASEQSFRETPPHYVPEKNPFLGEVTRKYGIPGDAALGKPDTLYPEYRKKISSTTTAP